MTHNKDKDLVSDEVKRLDFMRRQDNKKRRQWLREQHELSLLRLPNEFRPYKPQKWDYED